MPNHYGILLHGTPGCGKTSIIKATLEYTKRHAIVIPLNRVKTCGELETIFFKSEINSKNIPTDKRIYIFEDIDCVCDVIKERSSNNDNINDSDEKIKSDLDLLFKLTNSTDFKKCNNPEDKLNLSCILNIFDGILETPGRIIILTSNYPDKIDKALLRPGRIDVNIELKKASSSIIKDILSEFYDVNHELINEKDLIDYVLSPAEIMNICLNNINNIDKCISCIHEIMK
jgi:chaperone BCS1